MYGSRYAMAGFHPNALTWLHKNPGSLRHLGKRGRKQLFPGLAILPGCAIQLASDGDSHPGPSVISVRWPHADPESSQRHISLARCDTIVGVILRQWGGGSLPLCNDARPHVAYNAPASGNCQTSLSAF
jgi:hypothetical protein